MKSFDEVLDQITTLYSYLVFDGLNFTCSSNIGSSSTVSSTVLLQPRTYSTGMGKRMVLIPCATQLAQVRTFTKLKHGFVRVQIYPHPIVNIQLKPHRCFDCGSRIVYARKHFNSTLHISSKSDFHNIRFKTFIFDGPHFNYDVSSVFKLGNFQVAVEIANVNKKIEKGYGIIYQKNDTIMSATAGTNSIILQLQRVLNRHWKVGTRLTLNGALRSQVDVAWKADFGRNVIKTVLSTDGWFRTEYRQRITDRFDMVTTGSLSNPLHSFTLGVGFSWEPETIIE